MARIARVSKAPVRLVVAGETFEFDESGTRQVTAREESLLAAYTGPASITFEDESKKKEAK